MNQDEHYLNLLGISHYVVGSMTAFFACFPIIHLIIGITLVSGKFDGGNAPPPVFGWLFIIAASVFILLGWATAAIMIFAGRRLRQRRSHTFCFVLACFECVIFPFGTVLGVFSIIHLSKDSVRQLYTS
jgi:hypothetical protein